MKGVRFLIAALIGLLVMPPLVSRADVTALFDSTQVYYARRDVERLKTLLLQTDNRTLALLCRYRLYPLTQDTAYLDDLPTSLEDPTARELALLAGLWGYRVQGATVLEVPFFGIRSSQLLGKARQLDDTEPFVLLIGGQSLLFRPKIFGGDAQAALRRFRRLCEVLHQAPDGSISPFEAELWVWYALQKSGAEEADQLRLTLLARNPPPLYKAFLLDPL